ncbi:RagB/SusD family nutrient uptake outer membrane protein [Paraflavitalea sp. CAU 1676]|uniref:RagB/SusD family nutrient uptake outer membrane protein n=1 Tax=Paraflavitalea sp. CAU 1676 TaxID=3032598 RepID=UPI0023DB5E26|nr:RagB/SusD family nutrient uptake outer membrane protein [Paraflavitalea sp. CAU 1676]MDF2188010.1 RagB/SusD family nutrient uptake outer membrane protein [Paraflavitalea sp. CAU 1676]
MNTKFIPLLILIFSAGSCKKFVDLQAPDTSLDATQVFQNDVSATATINVILAEMASEPILVQGYQGVSVVTGLTGDELLTLSTMQDYLTLVTNNVLPNNGILKTIWGKAYLHIYRVNATIAGVQASTGITEPVRKQLLGEARFLRAFCYFYLVNLFGPVPVVTSTNYETNRLAPRQAVNLVYDQIIADLKEAQSLLPASYLSGSNSTTTARIRPNKWAATALLSRVYLYTQDWAKAEAQASSVIGQPTYSLDANLNTVFKSSAKEAIWQLPPVKNASGNTLFVFDGSHFSTEYLRSNGLAPFSFSYDISDYLNPALAASFEPGDKRKQNWLDSSTDGNKYYHLPFKYKNYLYTTSCQADHLAVLRLAEQYLLRAEARARQSNFAGAATDINLVRARAGLGAIALSSMTEALAALEQERRVELFMEGGHRWLDLKRWPGRNNPAISRAEEIMAVYAPTKGAVWSKDWLLYPIPQIEVKNGPNITQNPGYPQ